MAWLIVDPFREHRVDPSGAAVTGTLKCALLESFSPNLNTAEFWDDISSNEVSGAGYTAGGNECANPGVTLDGSGNVTFDADDPAQWDEEEGGFSAARRAVLYYDTGTPSTSRLVAISEDFGADKGNADGDFAIEFDEDGIIVSARAA